MIYLTNQTLSPAHRLLGCAVFLFRLARFSQDVYELRGIYPHIRLHLILPCSNEEQTEKWSEEERAEFYRILKLSDTTEYTSEHYYDGCMKKRNARLIELADCCFCYWDGRQRSGTGQTVRMAIKKNIEVVNFY